MENYKRGLALINSKKHYDELANSGFFTVVRQDDGNDTRKEVCDTIAAHFGLTTSQAVRYLSRYKALELYDRQYGYLHTQSFESNIRDLSAYCRRMGGEL